ncbi:CRISPR-associated helicase/endonuclease Cas3 [Anoxybacillus suryakundensis]|uniref:CRISPR-associated helicase, Cas3 family n=1 Tax=Anoxybacillus suryakundensis TaxID=1325335 RepID=A0A0K6GN48_9BACL|nr:CRISPR-associated helicase/endonuclease Cas3 [Anoxybacillus suryakundensis]CUA79983.1 CRISPR-associated helicase, Cas3 family [Anoxybacillus suryakundensis]
MNELYSHPNYPLQRHIEGVKLLSSQFLCEKHLGFTEQEWVQTLVEHIALFHDIGKSHQYFQDYIRGLHVSQKLKTHALLSAFVFMSFIKEYENIHDLWKYFSFIMIKRHHGDLDDWLEEWKQFSSEMEEQLLKQIEAIDFQTLNDAYVHLLPTLSNNPFTKCDFENAVRHLFAQSRQIRRYVMRWNNENDSLVPYVQFLFLFSLLLDADKSEAGIMQKEAWSFAERCSIASSFIEIYKKKQNWKNNKINDLRERAFKEITNVPIDVANHFYSLQLPTGMGKTLASFQFAFRLRQEIEKERGVIPRIVYSLPFLSIIDQTATVLEDVFRANNMVVDQRLFLSHHHLAEMQYSLAQDEERYDVDYDVAKLLIEGWNSEIVLTTFVQLFHTIFTNRNKLIRKFHRLANAIIIIDEVQAIPHRYWLVVKEMFRILAEELNCYFLFSTATTPAIFQRDEMVQLVEPSTYFQALSRVQLFPYVQKNMTIDEFVNQLCLDEEKSYLFIVNTIDCAKKLYEKLAEHICSEKMTFLSTHIPPKERLRRIHEMKSGKYRVVVSTQVVEAGVDIDFDVVYRDLAPLDSIHQAAGRCNRNGLKKGSVYVVSLTDGRRRYASYIYDLVRIDLTQSLLKNFIVIEESEFFPLIEKYFEQLSMKMNNRESIRLLNGIKSLYFDGEATTERIPISHFRLIEEGEDKFDVFIELDEEAKTIFQRFEQIISIKDPFERQKQFAAMKASFYQYVVSIPRKVSHKPPILYGIGYVNIDMLDDFYDQVLGYKTKSEGMIW